MTASEIRQLIIETVSKRGGHLASSLGAVEIAMALREEFDPFRDRIIWDVGHQAYAWKILTDRKEQFGTLRALGGISGFPNPAESKADAAVAGHAGVSISVAEGMAAARDLRGSDEHIVAVIGDASISNGTAFEALNNCTSACRKVIIVLNDNEMSISRPIGALSRHLGRLIAGARYNRFKENVKSVLRKTALGFVIGAARKVKGFFKRMLMGNAWFEQFGLRYIGPVNGHDVEALRAALKVAKEEEKSVLLHVVTKKGMGYPPAESDPTAWHGVGAFGSPAAKSSGARSWSEVFGDALCDLASRDGRIVALTAAMQDGTGLRKFAGMYPARFKDAGISEEHLVAYAAGLAAGGMRPVVAIYSTFLQRAIDQVIHDVAISRLPVVFCIDRAGAVGADGVTHQGLYDIALLRSVPNMTICEAKDAEDLKELLEEAIERDGPTAIRYPRGDARERTAEKRSASAQEAKIAIWATGSMMERAEEVAAQTGAVAVHARYIKPFDRALLESQRRKGMKIVSIENASVSGGLGEAIEADMRFGWPDAFLEHGSVAELEKKYGLDTQSIVEAIRNGA